MTNFGGSTPATTVGISIRYTAASLSLRTTRSTRSRQVEAIWRLGTRPAWFRAICHAVLDVLSNALLVCMHQRRHLCGNSWRLKRFSLRTLLIATTTRCHWPRPDRVAHVSEAACDHPSLHDWCGRALTANLHALNVHQQRLASAQPQAPASSPAQAARNSPARAL